MLYSSPIKVLSYIARYLTGLLSLYVLPLFLLNNIPRACPKGHSDFWGQSVWPNHYWTRHIRKALCSFLPHITLVKRRGWTQSKTLNHLASGFPLTLKKTTAPWQKKILRPFRYFHPPSTIQRFGTKMRQQDRLWTISWRTNGEPNVSLKLVVQKQHQSAQIRYLKLKPAC